MNKWHKKINLRSFAFLLAVVYLSVNLISAQFELMTKKQEYQGALEQKQRLELEVENVQNMLDEEDNVAYIEHVAREKLGYANPGETVYIDIQSE